MLSITREQFREIYKGTSVVEYEDLFYDKPINEIDLKNNFLPSKLWRLNNCYTIVNKQGKRIKFVMNLSQHRVYAASLRHPRVIVLKSRQQGISTLWLVSFFDDALINKDFNIGLMAQGQDEASTLLERIKILWDSLAPEVKRFFKVHVITDNAKTFQLNNKSQIFVRTSFRSTTLQRLHVSEMGKIANATPKKAKETKSGSMQAVAPGNIIVIESTAEGDNMFKSDYETAEETLFEDLTSRDFQAVFLSWIDDPDCVEEKDMEPNEKQQKYFEELELELGITLTKQQKNFWLAKWKELTELIYQEYPSTPKEAFMASKDGTYWASLYYEHVVKQKRLVKSLFDPNLPVQIAVDLGMNDTNVCTVYQYYNKEYRIIDEIYDHGQQISYYTDIFKTRPWFYKLERVDLPHDAEVKELTSGKTRKQVFQEELPGVHIRVLDKFSKREMIEMVRQMLKMLWIDEKCTYLTTCIKNYRKEWDERFERWRNTPYHGEESNGADSLQYMAVAVDTANKLNKAKRRRANAGHDV